MRPILVRAHVINSNNSSLTDSVQVITVSRPVISESLLLALQSMLSVRFVFKINGSGRSTVDTPAANNK